MSRSVLARTNTITFSKYQIHVLANVILICFCDNVSFTVYTLRYFLCNCLITNILIKFISVISAFFINVSQRENVMLVSGYI